MRLQVVALAAAALFAVPFQSAFAISVNSFNQIIAFGDSLSDPGNASFFAQTNSIPNIPPPGYATRQVGPVTVGYFTNPQSGTGPSGLWIDQLAAKMGLADPSPALLGGTNYSFASAQSGTANLQDMGNQVGQFLTQHSGNAPGSALYTFWGGANDLFDGTATGKTAADNIAAEIQAVAGDGGKTFLWLNLPLLGNTPLGMALGSSGLDTQSIAFDNEMLADITLLHAQGIDVIGVDASTLFSQVLGNPTANGFTDATDPCYVSASSICSNPNSFLFWDTEHPTTAADAFVANLAFNDLVSAPEPATCALLALGAMGFIAFRRSRRRIIG